MSYVSYVLCLLFRQHYMTLICF